MAYIGSSPSVGEFKKLDDISSQFNDATVTFALQTGGANVSVGSSQNLIVSIDGVIQEPGVAYVASGSSITFSEAPNTASTFFAVLLGSVGQVNVVGDDTISSIKLQANSVTEAKIATAAVTEAKIANVSVTTAKLSVTGVTEATYGNASFIPTFAVGVDGRITSAGNIAFSGGATLEDNTTADASYFPTLATSNTGSFSTAVVSSSKLFFNPNTGTLNATVVNSLSDITLKENLNVIENPLSLIKNLNGVEFNWSDTKQRSSGLVAQELEKVIPHLVSTNNGLKSVNYSGLIGYLVETIKELNSRIEKLERK